MSWATRLTSALGLVACVVACRKEAPPAHGAAPPSAASTPSTQGLPDRDPALARRLVEEQGAVLLDVRSDGEWQGGHLERATHLPVGELSSRLSEVETLTAGDKKKPIVVYCQSGGRAARAKQALLAAGYENVTNLGGIGDWPKGD